MEIVKNVLLVVSGITLLVLLWVWGVYNSLIKKRNQVRTDFSDIKVQLDRKVALVDKLTDMVREYSKHEKGTFEEVTKARSAVQSAGNAKDSAQAENMLTQALKSLMMVVEDYPKLQASQNFRDLRDDLKQIEDQIVKYREEYNKAVQNYNNSVEVFPNMIIASVLGFNEELLFDTTPTS